MDETLLGVVIGGAISLIPHFITAGATIWNNRQQRKHDLRIRRMDLVDAPRMQALQEFADQFGALMSFGITGSHSVDGLLAAMQKASLFVSEKTWRAMRAAVPALLRLKEDKADTLDRVDLLKTPELRALRQALYGETHLTFDGAYDPASDD